MLKKSISILLITSSLSAYHQFNININNDELESGIELDIAQFSKRMKVNRYFLGLDYLHSEDDETSSDSDHLTSVRFMMRGKFHRARTITFGLGGKVVNGSAEDYDVSAIPLGIYGNFKLPIKSLPISLTTQFFYSPKPLTFGDGNNYTEQKYELGFEPFRMGEIYIGYRDIQFETTPELGEKKVAISQMAYIGFRIGF